MSRFFRRGAIPVAAWAVLALGACETHSLEPLSEAGVEEPVVDVPLQKYTLVETDIALVDPESVTDMIGPEGGVLRLRGHRLRVPEGAVPAPTRFTMHVPKSSLVEVSLLAERWDAETDTWVNVGEKGFDRPVTLVLSYENAVGVTNAEDLAVVWMDDAAPRRIRQRLQSEHERADKKVKARLDHFSRYCLASSRGGRDRD